MYAHDAREHAGVCELLESVRLHLARLDKVVRAPVHADKAPAGRQRAGVSSEPCALCAPGLYSNNKQAKPAAQAMERLLKRGYHKWALFVRMHKLSTETQVCPRRWQNLP